MSELISIVEGRPLAITPGAEWTPSIGEELSRFLDRIPSDAKERVQNETIQVLARATKPGEEAQRAGLVVGYIQSGKTTSFTAAAALARDNEYALVIVIGGTSVKLLEQTQKRLRVDLGLDQMDAYQRWVEAKSPKPGSDDAERVSAALADWTESEPGQRPTVLITVMKQHRHLMWLTHVLQDISSKLPLATLSALIIDDEADQASPNVARQPDEVSATYGRIRGLRALLPSHTLLQYTATPQAPLLVSIVDEISPDYVCVIEPGSEYTGGRYFFQEHRDVFVREIPASDLIGTGDLGIEPPQSLLVAFANYSLGCAAGTIQGWPPQRSMLVHPSHRTLPQAHFARWLKRTRDLWRELLEESEEEPDRKALVTGYLRPAYEDLSSTVKDLASFDDLMERLPRVLRKIQIVEVNAAGGSPEPIPWSTGYSWVLVGGTLLDRGFTVEGLTVTYMPRSVGVGNADTVQQRARFFGYKASYAAFCRAWLDPAVSSAFERYVDHEETMRKELVSVATSGRSLKEWKRVFLLDPHLNPTRAAAIRMDVARPGLAGKWSRQDRFDLDVDHDIIASNRHLVDDFLSDINLSPDPGDDRRTDTQIHGSAEADLRDLLERLLTSYVMTGSDGTWFTALRMLLEIADERQAETCRVILMGPLSDKRRKRAVEDRKIVNLFQGANPGTRYPGDAEIRDVDLVCLQVHRLDLQEEGETPTNGIDVPVLAFWVPQRLDYSIIVEED
ncbi:MAG: Z1 domain-containing protein [Acidobacteriota bacterium]